MSWTTDQSAVIRRMLLLALGIMPVAGCSKGPPTMAHYQPVSHWVAVLHSPNARQRVQAVKVLGNVGPADPAVIPALAAALADSDAGVRREAALALVKIGPPAADAVTALRARLRDPDLKVRTYAARALEVIERPR